MSKKGSISLTGRRNGTNTLQRLQIDNRLAAVKISHLFRIRAILRFLVFSDSDEAGEAESDSFCLVHQSDGSGVDRRD